MVPLVNHFLFFLKKKLSLNNNYKASFEKANSIISSTISFIGLKSNTFLDKLSQRSTIQQSNVYNDTISNAQINFHLSSELIPNPQTTNVTLNSHNQQNTIVVDADSYYSREISFYNHVENLANNFAIETVQLTELPPIEIHQAQPSVEISQIPQPKEKTQRPTNKPPIVQDGNSTHAINKKLASLTQRRVPSQFYSSLARRFKCQFCQKEFKLKHQLANHERIHTGERPYVCEFCGKAFIDQTAIGRHILIHHKDRSTLKHECEVCMSRAISANCFSNTISETSLIFIKICHKKFPILYDLKHHIQLKHVSDEEKKFKCDQCNRGFVTQGALNAHMTLHTGEKKHECSICKMKFRLRSALKRHLPIHSDEKAHSCEFCNKSFKVLIFCGFYCILCSNLNKKNYFKTRDALGSHKKLHVSDKKFTCEKCGMKLVSLSRLKNHILTHTEEYLFNCEICQKKFKLRGNLNDHMKIHNESKQFECLVCEKNLPYFFAQMITLFIRFYFY